MKIQLHLGAHKTATTFIQRTLNVRRTELAAKNIGYASISQVRKQFTTAFHLCALSGPLLRPLFRAFLLRRFEAFAHQQPEVAQFILSDENLAGGLSTNSRLSSLYPHIGQRVRYLDDIFRGHETRYFFAIRRYPGYITSSWLQMHTKGRAPAFDRYIAKFPPEREGWAETIERLAAACGPERLTVWTYDWFRKDPARVFDLLAPDAALAIPEEELSRKILPSLTIKGLEALGALEKVLSRDEYVRMGRMLRNFTFDEPNPPLAIEDAGLLAAYEEKYLADLDRIRALGVAFYGE